LTLVVKLLADVAQALVHFILARANILDEPDDEPDRPNQEQGGDDGSEAGESRHFVFSLEKKIGEPSIRSPICE